MNEETLAWREYRKERQEKKRCNLKRNLKHLESKGIPFVSNNDGVHVVIQHNNKIIDFYPSTGLWKDRQSKRRARGILSLIRHLEGNYATTN